MTITQESTNGHRLSPPPCSFPDSQDQNRSEDSTDNNSNCASATPRPEAFAASAYHVPPKLYAPKADSFHDTIPDGLSTMKMPDRCQFMFSDGRQCKMARSDIHPSLCPYHSEREEQLFGTPHTRGLVRGPSFDLPELFSASRDLTTATGVNRALGQVFRLLAQRRISRQEAATFAKLAQLLLQSIRAASHEQPISEVVEREKGLAANVYPQDELRGGKEVIAALFAHKEVERRISPNPIPAKEIPSPFPPHQNEAASISQPIPLMMNPPTPRIPFDASPAPPSPIAINNSSEMSTSAASVCNSREINTSRNIGVETIQNQHLHQVRRERHGHQELRGVNKASAACSSGRPAVFLQRET